MVGLARTFLIDKNQAMAGQGASQKPSSPVPAEFLMANAGHMIQRNAPPSPAHSMTPKRAGPDHAQPA
jgi:hypothetical protein